MKIYSLTDFGPFELTVVNTSTSPDNLLHIKETTVNEKKLSKIRYGRVERETKIITAKYRQVVNENKKSGPGKILVGKWDELKQI